MATPGFTAEYGLYRSTAYYQTFGFGLGTCKTRARRFTPRSLVTARVGSQAASSHRGAVAQAVAQAASSAAPRARVKRVSSSAKMRFREYWRRAWKHRAACWAFPRGIPGSSICSLMWNSAALCPSTLQGCSGTCVYTSSDPSNCGGCGQTCPQNQTCQNGTCTACPYPTTFCNGICLNTSGDSLNCGGCGITCASGQACCNGSCTIPVPTATTAGAAAAYVTVGTEPAAAVDAVSGGTRPAVTASAARTSTFAAVVPAVPTETSAMRRRPAATAPASPRTISIAVSLASRAQ